MSEISRRTRRRRKARKLSDFEMLEELLQAIHEKLKSEELSPKIADFLKVLEMKYKLKLTGDGKDKLLDLIESVRKEELESADFDE